LAVGWSIRQTAKFNSLPKFPAIWYTLFIIWIVATATDFSLA
jgi:hypothetical protein